MTATTLTDENGQTYTYNAWNQMVTVKNADGAVIAELQLRRPRPARSQKPSRSTTTNIYFTSQWQDIEERQAGTVTRQNVWGLGFVNQLVERDGNSTAEISASPAPASAERLYAQQDANWSVTSLVDVSGDVVERAVYAPYGSVTFLTASWASTTDAYAQNVLFQGGRFETPTGTYIFEHREYDPMTGRWLQQDPVGYIDGTNDYSFVNDRPTGATDPLGLFSSGNHQLIVYTALNGSGLSANYMKLISDADVGVDDGWKNDTPPFSDDANHGDNGVPGIKHALDRIQDRWSTVISDGRDFCDSCDQIERAMREFGRMLHTIQDLYAHSNYVELMDKAAGGKSVAGSIPLWQMYNQPGNTPNIPAGVTTGNYRWPLDNAPPPNHRQMNHDSVNSPASEVKNAAGTTMFKLAMDLATRATAAAWNQLISSVQGTSFAKQLDKCNGGHVSAVSTSPATTQPITGPTTMPTPTG